MTKPSIEVYSCVTGKYDKIMRSILASRALFEDNVKFTLYSDQFTEESTFTSPHSKCQWNLKPLEWKHKFCHRRTARWHKLHSHCLTSADYSVWVDGSQQFKEVGVYADFINKLEGSESIYSFKHPQRSCVYQELQACTKLAKDNPKLMRDQVTKYRADGYPPYNGLVETACVVRKNSNESASFNKMWWEELKQHSYRDQLSFNYVAWKLGVNYGHFPGCRVQSALFNFLQHG
jgi:hypothetical protein